MAGHVPVRPLYCVWGPASGQGEGVARRPWAGRLAVCCAKLSPGRWGLGGAGRLARLQQWPPRGPHQKSPLSCWLAGYVSHKPGHLGQCGPGSVTVALLWVWGSERLPPACRPWKWLPSGPLGNWVSSCLAEPSRTAWACVHAVLLLTSVGHAAMAARAPAWGAYLQVGGVPRALAGVAQVHPASRELRM